jgi:hypothetical protein
MWVKLSPPGEGWGEGFFNSPAGKPSSDQLYLEATPFFGLFEGFSVRTTPVLSNYS